MQAKKNFYLSQAARFFGGGGGGGGYSAVLGLTFALQKINWIVLKAVLIMKSTLRSANSI
jgi:hypothetical protein